MPAYGKLEPGVDSIRSAGSIRIGLDAVVDRPTKSESWAACTRVTIAYRKFGGRLGQTEPSADKAGPAVSGFGDAIGEGAAQAPAEVLATSLDTWPSVRASSPDRLGPQLKLRSSRERRGSALEGGAANPRTTVRPHRRPSTSGAADLRIPFFLFPAYLGEQ